MSLLDEAPFRRLRNAKSVLVAGAGGGFDVYSGVPLALALRRAGKAVTLANLTFTYLGGTDAVRLEPALARIEPTTSGEDRYFPERILSRWLAARGEPSTVYAIDKMGVRPVRAAYARMIEEHAIDAIVLVDGGTDLLMRGDEAGLGTPSEDATSLAAVSGIDVPIRIAACLGFGIDAHHGVCHAQFLENVAALAREGAFLGTTSLLAGDDDGAAYLDLVAHANESSKGRESIVNNCIAAAVRGEFGDHHAIERTRGTVLFVSSLMSMYWAFDLPAVARASRYLQWLENTETIWDVQVLIEGYRKGLETRARTSIPG
jgi:hypothetical protein